jgi:23S rRNA (adenine1618-N6)-methyltransferase
MKELSKKLHLRNKHQGRYDLKQLVASCPHLGLFVKLNDYKDESIDFFNPRAVKMLNKALLKHYYQIDHWDIPEGYLCPPIPGRADYIHYMADLVFEGKVDSTDLPKGEKIKCLDVGVGANCVYPIIGSREYGWSFVGSDIDPVSIASARKIVANNAVLEDKIELRIQDNKKQIFKGIVKEGEQFDLTICNPPFHSSQANAQAGSMRKLRNLKGKKNVKSVLNFGGKNNELWCDGGEVRFVQQMIIESKEYSKSCKCFSTLISKESNLEAVYKALKNVRAREVKTIQMGQGNKVSRIVAWRF